MSAPDDLTGLETTPMDVVDQVRVQVLETDAAAEILDMEALRQTISTAQQRLGDVRGLRRQLDDLTQERDRLAEELRQTRQQLAEVKVLQQQLQALLELS
ncbi:MAG: hypothetical protein ACKN83_01165 [Vulcanococcus sp.]